MLLKTRPDKISCNTLLERLLTEANMLSLATWKNPKEKGEIKGHTCACITPEEKLKKTVTNLKRNKFNYDKF